MREARELLRLARLLMGRGESGVSIEGLRGAIQFSPKYMGGKNFWIKTSPDAILVRGPHGAEYFREIRWRDRHGELRLRNAPVVVIEAFDRYGGDFRKLIRALSNSGAFQLKKVAGARMAVKSRFTIIRPLSLKKEGATRDSLENARRLKDAGYELINGSMTFDRNKVNWEVKAYFFRKVDGSDGVHIFKGLSFGYGGEGPHGLRNFLRMFGWNPKDEKIFEHGYFEEEKGTFNLKAFT